MRGRRVLVGVGGGIAAYKVVQLVSHLVQQGADVDVVMTRAATRFVGPVTFQAITHRPVHVDLFDTASWQDGEMPHVELATAADVCVVAPATADLLARLAHGLANDLVTTALLALRCPLILAPAMDAGMYGHPATQANVALLRSRGAHVVGPEAGHLASGRSGLGRMSEPERILEAIEQVLERDRSLAGVKVVVTAGGTQEPIDPVRFIGNRSSGKMGYAIAAVATRRGAEVTLISGPSSLEPPAGVAVVRVVTTLDMQRAIEEAATSCDVVIMAAAVADYRVERPSDQKIKKTGEGLALTLVENPHILAGLSSMPNRPVLVGFAAETQDLLANAATKLTKTGADVIVANDVTSPGSGFGTDTNQATLLYRHGPPEPLPLMPKDELAGVILERVAELIGRRG